MAHQQTIIDSDQRWVINPDSREVAADLDGIELIQGDHNSERITFEIPRFVEGHDMSLSDRVEVHYINIDKKTRAQSKDIYISDDVAAEDDKVTFSWLISGNATKYYGSLNFIILFACFDQENNYVYKWNTEICKKISIGETISNTEAISEEYSDILEKFRAEVLKEVTSEVIIEKTLKNINAEYPNAKMALYRIGNWEFSKSGFYKFILEPASGVNGYVTQIYQKRTLDNGTTPEDFDRDNLSAMYMSGGDGRVEAFYAIVDYFDDDSFTTYKIEFINQPSPGMLWVNTYDKSTGKWAKAYQTNIHAAKIVEHQLIINKGNKKEYYNGSKEVSIDIPEGNPALVVKVTTSETDAETYIADHTYEEIQEAINAGRNVYLEWNNDRYYTYQLNLSGIVFSKIYQYPTCVSIDTVLISTSNQVFSYIQYYHGFTEPTKQDVGKYLKLTKVESGYAYEYQWEEPVTPNPYSLEIRYAEAEGNYPGILEYDGSSTQTIDIRSNFTEWRPTQPGYIKNNPFVGSGETYSPTAENWRNIFSQSSTLSFEIDGKQYYNIEGVQDGPMYMLKFSCGDYTIHLNRMNATFSISPALSGDKWYLLKIGTLPQINMEADPESDMQIATKKYVDNLAAISDDEILDCLEETGIMTFLRDSEGNILVDKDENQFYYI